MSLHDFRLVGDDFHLSNDEPLLLKKLFGVFRVPRESRGLTDEFAGLVLSFCNSRKTYQLVFFSTPTNMETFEKLEV